MNEKYFTHFCKTVNTDDYTRITLLRSMDGSCVDTDSLSCGNCF